MFYQHKSTWRKLKYEILISVTIMILLVFIPIITITALAGGNNISLNNQLYNGPGDPTDRYDYGNCTYWVYLLRRKFGETIPNNWGNANTWAINALKDHYLVNHTPSVGSIMQTSAGSLGHVAFVTSVSPLGLSWSISEMNVIGWDVVDVKTLPIDKAINFNFIHNNHS